MKHLFRQFNGIEKSKMPRKYVKKVGGRAYLQYSSESMDAALEAVRKKRYSLREAARTYSIPYSTLHDTLNGRHLQTVGGQTILTDAQEADLRETIKIVGEWGFPLTPASAKLLVKGFLDSNQIKTRFHNNNPGKDWFTSFMKRSHTLTTRWSENIKRNRAKVSHAVVNEYFDNLAETIRDVPPENIINFDETNFTDDPESKKVIVRKGQKHVENVLDHSKTSYSVMFAGAADGKVLPPYVVYAALHLYPTWTEGGPKGCRYNRTKSGKLHNLVVSFTKKTYF